jgi:predicted component of type VI protein secretion system
MVSRSSRIRLEEIARCTISAIAVLGLLALGGCSSSEPSSAEQAALAKTELHFSLDQCQPLDANLYKCPASDKPICNPDYNGQVECVRVGPKGSVFVQSGTP